MHVLVRWKWARTISGHSRNFHQCHWIPVRNRFSCYPTTTFADPFGELPKVERSQITILLVCCGCCRTAVSPITCAALCLCPGGFLRDLCLDLFCDILLCKRCFFLFASQAFSIRSVIYEPDRNCLTCDVQSSRYPVRRNDISQPLSDSR